MKIKNHFTSVNKRNAHSIKIYLYFIYFLNYKPRFKYHIKNIDFLLFSTRHSIEFVLICNKCWLFCLNIIFQFQLSTLTENIIVENKIGKASK